jgi:hypothetical protein
MSSSFEIIDWDNEKGEPTPWDGESVPMINDVIKQELIFFINSI